MTLHKEKKDDYYSLRITLRGPENPNYYEQIITLDGTYVREALKQDNHKLGNFLDITIKKMIEENKL